MATARKTLEIPEDLAFQRREWAIQRVCWVVMGLLILAGLLGLLGPGPFSSTSVDGATISVEHERFARYQTATSLIVEVRPGQANGELRIWLDRSYLDNVHVESIVPEPGRVELGADAHTYVFHAAPGVKATVVTFYLKPERMGRLRGRAGMGDEAIEFQQFVYP
jgi:protein-L-isoaspartate(D-aspartate) O-methyltransferase